MDTRLRKPERVYECYVEISRPKDGEDGQITAVYPKDYEIEDDTRKQLPKFAFPITIVNNNEEHFTFVLTDLDSKYRFGFCLYRPKGGTCMCIISDLPWYKVFYRALDKISELKLDMQNELVEPLLSGLYSHSLPSAGQESLNVVPSGTDEGQVYSFPLPTSKRLPEIPTDHNLTFFYTNIHYNVLLHLFANMLFERRIIITSKSLSLLSASVHGAALLLYPLHWQHIFIPIMPQHLKDYCAAPMPFLVGIHSSLMDQVRRMPMDDVVILDMDENVIESPNVEDLANMPEYVISELKHVLKKESSGYGDNAAKAFLLAMVSMIGGYRKALKFREGEKEVVFDEEAFFTSRPQMEQFLESLMQFQHFRQFINHKIDQLKNQTSARDLFDREVMFYDEEMKGTTQEQIKLAFTKFMTSTKGGGKKLLERGEKWSTQFQKGVTKGYGKIVDKKSFQRFVKDTKKTFHEMGKEPQFDQLGTLENGPAISGMEKSNTYPGMTRSPSDLSDSSQHAKKPPPRVIPYRLHQEGKKRLAESLLRQHQRTSGGSLQDQSGMMHMLTPPDTPRGTLLSNDLLEKASLDSRGSTEASASMSSGEVATGNLIDLTLLRDEARPGVEVTGEEAGAGEGAEEEEEEEEERSLTDSMVTTASSSSGDEKVEGESLRKGWVNFEDESSKPPLPPPRSELVDSGVSDEGTVHANPAIVENTDRAVDFNPFSSIASDLGSSGRVSPFEDFSAQIAQTLFSQSRNRASLDAYSANLMASASRDIYMTLDTSRPLSAEKTATVKTSSLQEPLIPTSSSSASVSSLDSNCTGASCNRPSTNPFAAAALKSTVNGCTGSPNHSLMLRDGGARTRGPPPPKPQPYSGKPVSALQQTCDDPFSNLLGGISMQAYACSGSSPTPHQQSGSPSPEHTDRAPEHTDRAPVQSPLV